MQLIRGELLGLTATSEEVTLVRLQTVLSIVFWFNKQEQEMRTNFEMSHADLETLLDAMKPVAYMVFGGIPPRSQQENANAAWSQLGQKMGFDAMTVRPGHGDRFFSAEVHDQKQEQEQ